MLRPFRRRLLFLSLLLGLAAPAALAQPMPAPLGGGVGGSVAQLDGEIARLTQSASERRADAARLEAELGALAAQRRQQQDTLRSHVRALYRMRRAGMLPVAGGFHALLAHVSRLGRLERMVANDLRSARFLRERVTALREEAARATLEADRADAQLATLTARRGQAAAEERAAALFQDVFAPRLPVTVPSTPAMGHGTFRVVDQEPAGPRFASLRGRLAMPVAGASDVRTAVREDGPGLEMVAPAGTVVRSVADGRVAFEGRHGAYGRLVIVDHEGSYFTVYAGLGTPMVHEGDWVGRGARLGTVAPGSPSALFFEVRNGTRALDARSWLGL